MKISTSLDILALILTICLIIIFVIYLALKYKKPTKEQFNDYEVNDNFYNLQSSLLSNKTIGSSELCIYEMNGTNEITDIECINGQEIATFNELPQFRKELVCIEEECLNSNDARLLRGEQSDPVIKLHTNHIKSNQRDTPSICLGTVPISLPQAGVGNRCAASFCNEDQCTDAPSSPPTMVPKSSGNVCPASAPTCYGYVRNRQWGTCQSNETCDLSDTLGSVPCDSATEFKLHRTNIKSSTLMNMVTNSQLWTGSGLSGSSESQRRLVSPVHL